MSLAEINPAFCVHFDELIAQDSLCSLIQEFPNKFKFLAVVVINAYKTHNSTASRFHPNPVVYFKHMYNQTLRDEELDEFITIISRESNGSSFFDKIQLMVNGAINTDRKLVQKIYKMSSLEYHETFVKLLYFFIFSNQVSFTAVQSADGIETWKIQNSIEKEREFSRIPGETKMLYHGTNAISMYSIMRNGLKSLSGTSLMSAGSAFGSGIYASDAVTLSLGYTGMGWDYLEDPTVSGLGYGYIFILKVKRPNMKSSAIFVQKNEEVLICGLVSFKIRDSTKINLAEFIDRRARAIYSSYHVEAYIAPTKLKVEENVGSDMLTMKISANEPSATSTVMNTKRVKKEVENLMNPDVRSACIRRVNFYNKGNNTSPLLVELIPDNDTPLYEDCQRYNIPGIVVAIYFEPTYPMAPPKIRVVYPKFVRGTGRITEGGSICADVLYKNGWSPACNLDSTLVSLISLMSNEGQSTVDGESSKGRIDGNSLGKQYSFNEFLTSVDFVASVHTWTK